MSICISFDLNPVEITDALQFHENEMITFTEQMQPVELDNFPEVESIDSESDIDPFTTMCCHWECKAWMRVSWDRYSEYQRN